MPEPIQPEVREEMNRLAQAIKAGLPKGLGFALLVFDRERGGFMNYISDSDRNDMLQALRNLVTQLENS